jgi:SET domain-containing protein
MRAFTKAVQLFKRSSPHRNPVTRQSNAIEIKNSPIHGQGVFAIEDCPPGTIIEIAPVILLSQPERELLRHTLLFGYYFVVDHPDYAIAMGLGASSLLNHSHEANAEYSISIEDQAITITARKRIRKGEEITLNYNGSPDDPTPVYFPPLPTEQDASPEQPASPQEPAFRDPADKQLYLRDMPKKGRGVFCHHPIPSGSLIETSILLVFPAPDYPPISHTRLTDYIFHFDKDQQWTALALGFGSLYNHALYPNASYEIDHGRRLIRYYATENIAVGTEICINYDGSAGSEEWFKIRNIPYSY